MDYEKDPTKIEAKSMSIIDKELKQHSLSPQELSVVKRMIHTSGDYDYQDIAVITSDAFESGLSAINAGCAMVTDTKMAMAGINKRVLANLGCTIANYVDHDEVVKPAKSKGITRSMAAIDFAIKQEVDIFVIGNAPTALFRLGELIEEKKIAPKLIVAVPVGFVGAAESKAYIRSLEVPSISTIGTKGGSNIAAAVINALLYWNRER